MTAAIGYPGVCPKKVPIAMSRVKHSLRCLLNILLAIVLLAAVTAASAAELWGIALKANGTAAQNVRIELEPKPAHGEAVINADSNGRFHYPDLKPGGYILRCGNGPAVTLTVGAGKNVVECRAN